MSIKTFNVRTKAFVRIMSEETLAKLRATRRANQSDFTLSCNEKSGNRFTISQAAFEELGLDKNSASFDVTFAQNEDGTVNDPSEVGAYLLVIEGDKGIFFKGAKVVKEVGGKKSKTITYDQLVEDLQSIGQVPANIVNGETKAHFDLQKVEGDIESGDPEFVILSAWKLVISDKELSADASQDELEKVSESTDAPETETPATEEEFDDFK